MTQTQLQLQQGNDHLA